VRTRQTIPIGSTRAVRQLIDKAIVAEDGVIDVFAAAGIKKPDISILSEQFLAEVRGLRVQERCGRAS
jgi:type I restriction enzyme R subunit